MDESKTVVVIYLDFNELFDKKPYIIVLGKEKTIKIWLSYEMFSKIN